MPETATRRCMICPQPAGWSGFCPGCDSTPLSAQCATGEHPDCPGTLQQGPDLRDCSCGCHPIADLEDDGGTP